MENFEPFVIETKNSQQQKFIQRLLIEEDCLIHGNYNGENSPPASSVFDKEDGLLNTKFTFFNIQSPDCFGGYTTQPSHSASKLKDPTPSNIIKALSGEYEFEEDQPFDKLFQHEVKFNENEIQIGCKTLTIDQINTLYDALNILQGISDYAIIRYHDKVIHSQIKQAKEYYE